MRPQKCITVDEAKALQKNWKKTRAQEIERAQKYEDTREFWYSLDELQEYINYVRAKTDEQGLKNPGIRIYFGAYPQSQEDKSYSTVFLVPTSRSLSENDNIEDESNENNYDIDPLNHGSGGIPPTSY